MIFTVIINTDNAALMSEHGGTNGTELARILRNIAERVDQDPLPSFGHGGTAKDINGNTVGDFEFLP